MAVAWVLLFGAPTAAGALAARRRYGPDDPGRASAARAWQGFAAGLVSNGVGALTVTMLGTGTTALMLKSAWVRDWLYHGQHLTASAVYGRELDASQDGRAMPRSALSCRHRGPHGRGRLKDGQHDRSAHQMVAPAFEEPSRGEHGGRAGPATRATRRTLHCRQAAVAARPCEPPPSRARESG